MMNTYVTRDLLALVEQYLAATLVPSATFGRKAVNDPRIVRDMREGRQVREATAHRLLDYMTRRLEILTFIMDGRLAAGAGVEA